MLKAGYLEDWKYHETLSGCPQGGVVSLIAAGRGNRVKRVVFPYGKYGISV